VGRSNSSNPKFLIVISLVTPQLDFLKLAHIHGMLELSHKAKVEDAIILVGRLISYIKISKNKPFGIIPYRLQQFLSIGSFALILTYMGPWGGGDMTPPHVPMVR
jgi:hypothetical protein